jgi:hypothetical protein
METGRRSLGRLAAYSRQFSFSSQTRNPNMPGVNNVIVVAISPPQAAPYGPAKTLPSAGVSGSRILCETVTTGKCLIGLTCGSTSKLTQKRIT